MNVLLAEDNLVNQRVAQLMLRNLGHDVDIVDNGQDAVNAVQHTPYHVVLMDISMPRMDGLEATRIIRAHATAGDRPYIVALTASGDRASCAAAGMDEFLAKPVRGADFKVILANAASTSSARLTHSARAASAVPDPSV